MSTKKRAVRRHQMRKKVAKARRLFGFWHDDDVYAAETARRLADNISACSCPACGNPRKWLGEASIQERKMAEKGFDYEADEA